MPRFRGRPGNQFQFGLRWPAIGRRSEMATVGSWPSHEQRAMLFLGFARGSCRDTELHAALRTELCTGSRLSDRRARHHADMRIAGLTGAGGAGACDAKWAHRHETPPNQHFATAATCSTSFCRRRHVPRRCRCRRTARFWRSASPAAHTSVFARARARAPAPGLAAFFGLAVPIIARSESGFQRAAFQMSNVHCSLRFSAGITVMKRSDLPFRPARSRSR